jgi:hypothetical protein
MHLVFEPVLAYNLTLVIIALLNYGSLYSLARTQTDRIWMASPLAMLGATAPAVASRFSGHLQLTCVFAVVLLLREALVTTGSGRDIRPVRLAAFLVMAYLCSAYFLVIGLAVFGIAVASFGLLRERSQILRVLAAALLVVITLTPFWLARANFEWREHDARTAEEEVLREQYLDVSTRVYSTDAVALAVPSPYALVDLGFSDGIGLPRTIETVVHPGLVLLLALFLSVIVAHPLRRTVRWSAAIVAILAMGPILRVWGSEWALFGDNVGYLPYELTRRLPVLDGLRAPGRFAIALPVVAVVGAASACERLLSDNLIRAAVKPIVAMSVIATAFLSPVSFPAIDGYGISSAGDAIGDASHDVGDAMLVVPADCTGFEVAYMHIQVGTDIPLAGCGPMFQALPWASEMRSYISSPALRSLRCDPSRVGFFYKSGTEPVRLDVEELRREFSVRYLVVDRWALAAAGCEAVSDRVAQLENRFGAEASNSRFSVIDLDALPH